jgi:hypothetical protein
VAERVALQWSRSWFAVSTFFCARSKFIALSAAAERLFLFFIKLSASKKTVTFNVVTIKNCLSWDFFYRITEFLELTR